MDVVAFIAAVGVVLCASENACPEDVGGVCFLAKEFKADLASVAEGSVRSLLFEFQETKDGELVKGLDAPVCQFVCSTPSPWVLPFRLPNSQQRKRLAQMNTLVTYV